MNRRKLFAFLGIGSVGAIVPKLWSEPAKTGWLSSGMTKKILDDRVADKISSLQGISDFQASLLRMKTLGPFLKKAKISTEDAKEILDSISVQNAINGEEDFNVCIRESSQKTLDELGASFRKINEDVRDEKILSQLPGHIKENSKQFSQLMQELDKLDYPTKDSDRASLARLKTRLFDSDAQS